MSELPRISGREIVKALKRVGYEQDRQRGSHIILRQTDSPHRRVTVPEKKLQEEHCEQSFVKSV